MPHKFRKCPFCGNTNLAVIDVYGEDFYVECLTCTTCGPSGETDEEAITAWNKRYAESEIDFDYGAED